MIMAALFTIARTWKQPRCPLADEWIWNIIQLLKEKAFESVLMRWMNLEPICQKEKDKYCILMHTYEI